CPPATGRSRPAPPCPRRARWAAAAVARRRTRRGRRAAPAASTTSRPQNPAPSRAPAPPARSGGRGLFFGGVRRVGTGHPVLGPLPRDTQPLEEEADGLGAEYPRGPAALVADLGHQRQRPQAGGLAEVPRAAVQQVHQVAVAAAVPGGAGAPGHG